MGWKDDFPQEGRYFETDSGILYNGDCIDVMNKLPEHSIDLIITSPPYNVGIDYKVWNDSLTLEEYFEFVEKFLKGFKRILKDDGRFAINIPYDINMRHLEKPTRVSLLCEYYHLVKKVRLNYNSIIDLTEEQPQRSKLTAWGSWMSPSSPYIYNPKECILVGYNKQWKKQKKGVSDLTKEEFIELVFGWWKYNSETKQLTVANFSEDLPRKTMKILSFVDDIILDPFMGSGTTQVQQEKLDRRWIGIEINKEFCDVTKKRLIHKIKQLSLWE